VKVGCLLAVVAVVLCGVVGCGSEQLVSVARDREITVDADVADWQGRLKFLEDANLSYGITNDARSMYLVLVVGDREVRRQIIMSGLYLWFDPAGKENRRFGIRFPIGLQEDIADVTTLLREQDPNKLSESFAETVQEMLVIGPQDRSWRRASVGTVDGIETAAMADANKLVLEFKVPVSNDGQYGYGIGALPGDVVGLGVETPEIDPKDIKEHMRSAPGGPGGGAWGGGGRGGVGAERPPGGPRPPMPDPIKVWTKVQLAAGAAGS